MSTSHLRFCRPALRTLVALLTVASSSACGDPCKDLALKICDCAATAEARKTCTSQVQARAGQRHKDANTEQEQAGRDRCANLIDGCSCDALKAGNLQACGLSVEPPVK
jgi:hypothetical protein